MNTNFKQSVLKLAVVSVLALGGVTSALAASVGGSVPAINDVTSVAGASITAVGGVAQTGVVIMTGTIDNNNEFGWSMNVVSTNAGQLRRTSGSGDNAASRITYTNVSFLGTGGTLGAGLIAPDSTLDVATAAAAGVFFRSGTGATTASVAYAYALKIGFTPPTTLLSGTYGDTVTVTLATGQ